MEQMNPELDKFDGLYMGLAKNTAKLSYAKRLQVGAIVVSPDRDRVISIGYNGTPPGFSNVCEDTLDDGTLVTRQEVIHAERNAIFKLARDGEPGKGATLYCTHLPCMPCAQAILMSGINTVVYDAPHNNNDSIEFLQRGGVKVIKYF